MGEFKKKFDADIEHAHQDFIQEVDNRGEEISAHLIEIDGKLDKAAEFLKEETVERVKHISEGTAEMQAQSCSAASCRTLSLSAACSFALRNFHFSLFIFRDSLCVALK